MPADPLPSWRDGPARRAILRFVSAVTRPGSPDYVPPPERIATFDNDGTLMAEKPHYFQLYFVIERIRELAPQHPEWKQEPPFATVLSGDGDHLADLSREDLERLVLAASAGTTEDEYVAAIERFLAEAKNPELGLRFPQTAYQPMLELIRFLRARGFKVLVCSAAGPEMIRGFSEKTYGVAREGLERPKAGFAVPLRHWLRAELKEMMQDLLSPASLREHGLVDERFVQSLIRDHLSGRWNYERQLWALMVFQLWHRAQKQ